MQRQPELEFRAMQANEQARLYEIKIKLTYFGCDDSAVAAEDLKRICVAAIFDAVERERDLLRVGLLTAEYVDLARRAKD